MHLPSSVQAQVLYERTFSYLITYITFDSLSPYTSIFIVQRIK